MYIYVYMYICIYVYIYMCVCVCVCVYIHVIRIIDIFTIYIPLVLFPYAGLVDCLYTLTCPAWVTLPGAYTPAGISLGVMEANNSLTQAPNHGLGGLQGLFQLLFF